AVFVIGFIVFLFRETKAPSPMMPLGIWKNRLITFANAATLTSGAIMIGLSSFLPTYVQGIMGYSAIVAGFTLTAMSIGWPLASTLAGFLILKTGPRTTAMCGGISMVIGAVFFVLLDPAKGPLWAGMGSFFIGIGMGLTSTTFIVSIQNSVDWKTRGVATASNMFMRILGSSLGAALLGGLLNGQLKDFLNEKEAKLGQSVSIDTANILLDGSQRSRFSEKTLEILQEGLTSALHTVYWGVFFLAVLTLLLTIYLPKRSGR
ncbi:MAG TPA: MFS transporter, partial [Bacillales bacterium]